MARPPKSGLSYFPFDVEFFADKKIRALKGRYGADGITLYMYLLCQVYRDKGYYLKVDDDFMDVTADDLNFSSEKIGQIMNFLLERSLFEDKLFKSDKVLTARGIQLRFQEVKKKAKTPLEVEGKFWVLNENETEGFVKFTQNSSFSQNNPHYSEKNPHYSENNSTKKSKVNKSKEKKSIIIAVVEYLNASAGVHYRNDTPSTVNLIGKRLDEGFTVEDFKTVINKKVKEWKGTEMEKYLRPETLFGNKFEGYLNSKEGNKGKFGNYSCTTNYDYSAIEGAAIFKEEKK